jgi:flagellar hook-associated protein 1 FlgK
MLNFDIPLRGLDIAQRAIDLAGTNISNAGTAGYHRQDLIASPLTFNTSTAVTRTGGQSVYIRRQLDVLLEREALRQQPTMGQLSEELSALSIIERSLGDMEGNNLGAAIDSFFASLSQLAAHPEMQAYQVAAVQSADAMAQQFHNLDAFIGDQLDSATAQANALVARVNNLTTEIAELNGQIAAEHSYASNTNLLQDRRDQALTELAELVNVQTTQNVEFPGVVNISAWGTPLVIGNRATPLAVQADLQGRMGLTVQGANYVQTDLNGGRLGGLIALHNELLPELRDKLDTLAAAIATEVNRVHAQGLGAAGSFTELSSAVLPSGLMSTWEPPVQPGMLQVRIIADDGTITRRGITIDPMTQTLSNVASAFAAVGITASIGGNVLRLRAPAGCTFDFSPALLPTPATSTLSGTSSPTISGIYSGQHDSTLTVTVVGSGTIGSTEGLSLRITDGATIRTVNVGAGYPAGTPMELIDGVKVAMSAGTLIDGQQFTISALASSDASTFLATSGLNTLFTGLTAGSIGVRDDLLAQPWLLATSIGGVSNDNENINRMAALGEEGMEALGGRAASDYFRLFVADVAEAVATRQSRSQSVEKVIQQLDDQREQITGVDINQESAKLLVYERMFQAASKVLATQDKAMEVLMSLL